MGSPERPLAAVLDDDEQITTALGRVLEREGYETLLLLKSDALQELFDQRRPELLFLDINLGTNRTGGLQLLPNLVRRYPELRIVVISGETDIQGAVAALKKGAADFLEKPIHREDILRILREAEKNAELKRERDCFLGELLGQKELLGSSPSMAQIRSRIADLALLKEPVLITGESGTGKELVAANLHLLSARRAKPLVSVNMAALSDSLVESQLFGVKKGAYTGAEEDREGYFHGAHGSTLFLDEIGDMKLELQAKILRVVQDGEFMPLGTSVAEHSDARLVFATNKDLEEEVRSSNFREDLFYRISTLHLHIPPLRERREDITVITRHLVSIFCQENKRPEPELSSSFLEKMQEGAYKGNVRELKNRVIRILAYSGVKKRLTDADAGAPSAYVKEDREDESLSAYLSHPLPLGEKKREMEARYLIRQLQLCGGDMKKLAAKMAVAPPNLYRKFKALRIRTP